VPNGSIFNAQQCLIIALGTQLSWLQLTMASAAGEGAKGFTRLAAVLADDDADVDEEEDAVGEDGTPENDARAEPLGELAGERCSGETGAPLALFCEDWEWEWGRGEKESAGDGV
jgi:hypothetical protein